MAVSSDKDVMAMRLAFFGGNQDVFLQKKRSPVNQGRTCLELIHRTVIA
jgi:hypothetical protein